MRDDSDEVPVEDYTEDPSEERVYIVTTGDYSHYRIGGVFSDLEAAREAASNAKWGPVRVEVWTLETTAREDG